MWIEVISAFVAGCFGVLALLGALAAHRHARAAAELSQDRGMPLLKSQVSGLAERLDAMEELLKRIDARDRMRSVRLGKRATAADEPDPFTDPQGWKSAMRRRKALGGE